LKYTEEELVMLLKSGDRSAFEYLYDNYSGALNAVILKLINDRQLAEDLLQEAFVRIWNNFSTYDSSKGRLFTWMLNITRNLTIDTMRSKSFKKQAKIQKDEIAVTNKDNNTDEINKFDA
jgi:RNA polymerase sigma-70 factor (ECF subfamily)